jgi:uncharacterized protein YidB (DUF937 family)
MSLLDLAAQAMGGANSPGGNSAAINAVVNLVHNYPGGLGGMVSSFEQKGMGGVVGSWIGSGPNQQVSPQQIQNGLGTQAVQDVATKLGVSPDMASGVLAQLLPSVVDHLTPNGQVPAAGSNILAMGESILKGLMK